MRHRWGEVVRTSAEYFRKLRETVRSDYEIAFDAHAKIFEVGQAIQLGNALAPYDPLFFEEPIRPENIEAWGELKRGLNCTLATGESLYSRFEFLRLLSVKGCDIIQPDICVVGGLLGDAQDRRHRRGALRHRRAAQPDGAAGDRREPAFLRPRKPISGFSNTGCRMAPITPSATAAATPTRSPIARRAPGTSRTPICRRMAISNCGPIARAGASRWTWMSWPRRTTFTGNARSRDARMARPPMPDGDRRCLSPAQNGQGERCDSERRRRTCHAPCGI